MFDHYYLPQLALYTQWVNGRVFEGDTRRPFKPAAPLPMQEITEDFYNTPLADMAPPHIEDRKAAYRTALERLAASFS